MSQHKPAPASEPDAARSNRPLGRGLENVSHVFLSQQGGGAAADPVGPWAARPVPREDAVIGALLLRPAARVSRERVGPVLREFVAALEEGLRLIDADIPCGPCGEIDLLALDRASQLAVIDFDTGSGDELLLRGLAQLEWLVRNVPILRRMFRGHAINFSLAPRLFLLAPHFSDQAQCAARQITGPQIGWVRYHLLEAPGQAGILFEPLVAI